MSSTMPAGEALMLTATQLEDGGEGLEGALGDGEGKWRLTVEFDNPLTVMSLLESPAGHLSNLSATARPEAVLGARASRPHSVNIRESKCGQDAPRSQDVLSRCHQTSHTAQPS